MSEVTAKTLKKLNDKISDHGKCASHKYCSDIIASKMKGEIEERIMRSSELWQVQNERKIAVTARVFRMAYRCCMQYELFTAHTDKIK